MITNLIFFLYGIKVKYIRKNRDNYVFSSEDKFYIFKEINVDENYLMYIYPYINNSMYHYIIKNNNNKFVSFYDNKSYLLMLVKFNVNRYLLLNDILLNKKSFFYIKKNDFNWISLWKNKIDQVEYYVNSNFDKINISVLSIINYYIYLTEIGISCFNYVLMDSIPLSLCHNRVLRDFDLYEYYCVTNLVFDHYTRDLGEYIKNFIYMDKKIDLDDFFILKELDYNDRWLLISRILFSSYFFDLFDDFVMQGRDFNEFELYFVNNDIYESNLKEIVLFLLN